MSVSETCSVRSNSLSYSWPSSEYISPVVTKIQFNFDMVNGTEVGYTLMCVDVTFDDKVTTRFVSVDNSRVPLNYSYACTGMVFAIKLF